MKRNIHTFAMSTCCHKNFANACYRKEVIGIRTSVSEGLKFSHGLATIPCHRKEKGVACPRDFAHFGDVTRRQQYISGA